MFYSLALLLAATATVTPLPTEPSSVCQIGHAGYKDAVSDQVKIRKVLESMIVLYKNGDTSEADLAVAVDLHAKISEQVGSFKFMNDSFCS